MDSLSKSPGSPAPDITLDSVLTNLLQATSPDTRALAIATDLLSGSEHNPSFWVYLLDIAFERHNHLSIPQIAQEKLQLGMPGDVSQEVLDKRWSAIRSLAIIRFKAGVDKYWRSRIVNRVMVTIPQDVKEQLRTRLLRCLEETDRSVALQASVCIARIARHDFPNNWPDLFTTLQQTMVQAHAQLQSGTDESKNRMILLRAADVCHKTLKELSSVRILAGKIRMTELAQQLIPTLLPMFQQYFSETLPSSGTDIRLWAQAPFIAERVRTCQLFLKSVTSLSIADMGTLSRNSQVAGAHNLSQEFFGNTPAMLQHVRDTRWAFLANLTDLPEGVHTEAILRALLKHLLSFGKLYLGLLNREKSKAVTWQGWDQVVLWYWQQVKDVAPDELAVTSKSIEGDDNSLQLQRPFKHIVQALLLLQQSLVEWKRNLNMPSIFENEEMVLDVANTLVDKLIPLTKEDLELWQEDPEDWSVAEEADTYNMDVRPIAERTLVVLSQTCPKPQSHLVGSHLWQRFEVTVSRPHDGGVEEVLKRDALYAALGRCRDDLSATTEMISNAVAHHLVPEASLAATDASIWVIIRRRIAWLIWEWSEKIAPSDRAAVYGLLVSLLEDVPGKTDAAVRLAAARSLAALADALEFDSEAFHPYIDASLTRLATLSANAELHEMDSIRTCTNTMSILIERLGARIAPHLEQLASLVPRLWVLDDPECKARPSIIVFLGHLVRSVELIPHGSQGASTSLHSLIEVVIRDSLQPSMSPLLGKDAMELWIRALRSSSQMTEPLFRLLDLLSTLLNQPDFNPEACRVCQEATLTAAEPVISQYGQTLFTQFANIIGDAGSPLILHPISALDLMVQAMHSQCVDKVSWAALLDQSGLFTAILGSLLHVKESTIVTGYFVALLSRIAFIMEDSPIFLDLVQASAQRLHGPQCDVAQVALKPMIESWCSRIETMASTRKRKITALGLASLLSSPTHTLHEAVYDMLPQMLGVWMDMMGDGRQESNDDSNAIPIPIAPPSSPLLSRASSQPVELTRRSPSPALSIPGLEGLDDGDEFQETSPGRARMTELNRMDPVNSVKLTTYLAEKLHRAQELHGEVLQARFASMDPLVLELFQKDLER